MFGDKSKTSNVTLKAALKHLMWEVCNGTAVAESAQHLQR